MEALVECWVVEARRYPTTGSATPGHMVAFWSSRYPAWVTVPGIPWVVTGMML